MNFIGKKGLIVSAGMLLAGGILFGIGALNGGVEQVQAMAENGELSIGGASVNHWFHRDNMHAAEWEGAVTDVTMTENGIYYDTAEVLEGDALIHEWAVTEGYDYGDNVEEIAKKDEIKKLEIDWDDSVNGELSIYTVNDEYFWITEGNFTYKIKGDTIKLSQKSGFSYITEETCLFIPESWAGKEIELSVGAGTVYAERLCAEKVSIEVGAGYMECVMLDAGELDVEIGAGSFHLYEFITEKADIEVGIGVASMQMGTITGDLDAECGIGSLTIGLIGKETDHNYKISSVGGLTIGGYSRTGLGNNYRINNNKSSNFDIECGLGTIDIYFDESYIYEN